VLITLSHLPAAWMPTVNPYFGTGLLLAAEISTLTERRPRVKVKGTSDAHTFDLPCAGVEPTTVGFEIHIYQLWSSHIAEVFVRFDVQLGKHHKTQLRLQRGEDSPLWLLRVNELTDIVMPDGYSPFDSSVFELHNEPDPSVPTRFDRLTRPAV
jgi:hypothetical protein